MKDFLSDLARYRSYDEKMFRIACNPALWCIAWYRLGRWIYKPRRTAKLLWPFRAAHFAGSVLVEALLQMRLNVRAEIGPGLLIAHCGGITLHPDVVIGSHCDLAHHVTVGTRGVGGQGVPRLGDRVYVGTNAVLIGAITVGDGARIGANSLVLSDVPAGATVLGVPAVIVGQRRRVAERVPSMAELSTE